MKVADFDFHLPEELIAQYPLEPRDSSRLMVIQRKTGEICHHQFAELGAFLKAGDVLVINSTKVIPARLIGEKEGTSAKIELLLLKRVNKNCWETLVRPGKRLKPGQTVCFGGGLLRGQLVEILADGNRIMEFFYDGVFEEVLDRLGQMPLPPYITTQLADQGRYQTVYAKESGSAAAPTAGLHFTPELLLSLQQQGIEIVEILLHVGLGTFRPVKAENIIDHQMHTEYYCITPEAANRINLAKQEGRRVIAVGTTATRTLESMSDELGLLHAGEGFTDIFIYPGYTFKILDGLITNFHFPRSTLLMLVSALAGRDLILQAYHLAVENNYRFYSFGDAMLIL